MELGGRVEYSEEDTKEGDKDLYHLVRQSDRAGQDMQQIRVIKLRDGIILTSEESVQRRWSEYSEELTNVENEKERRVDELETGTGSWKD